MFKTIVSLYEIGYILNAFMLPINCRSSTCACTLSSPWILILEPFMKLTFFKADEWYTKFYEFPMTFLLPFMKVSHAKSLGVP